MTCLARTFLVLSIIGLALGCTSKRDDSNRLVNQALEKVSASDFATAKSKLQLAIATDPTNANAYHTRAAILSKEGRPSEAIADFEKAVELNPENADWRYELAGKLWEVYQGDVSPTRTEYLPKIEEHVSKAIELRKDTADYFLLRARCRKAQYAFKGSAQDYREAIRLDPLNAQTYLELGRLYSQMTKVFYRDDLFALAEEVLSSASGLGELPDLQTESESVLPDMGFELGMLYAWRGSVEADAAAAKGFRDKAIEAYLAIEADYRDRSSLNVQLAQVYQQNGDSPKACTAAREALVGVSADPNAETLRNYIMNLEQEVCVTATGYDPNR